MRRGYPKKKVGFLKLLAGCQKILKVLEEEGPCGHKKLRERTNIPRMTINRRLTFLERLGLIMRKDRKWMLVARVKTYKNSAEYKIHLGHSWELVKGIFAINEFLPQFVPQHDFYAGDILTGQRKKLKLHSSPEMWPYALQHLKTGYPDIFSLFEKCIFLLKQVQCAQGIKSKSEKTLNEIAKELLYIQSIGVQEDLSAEGTNDIDEKSESTPILTKEERFKLDEQTAEARRELENQLTKIIWKVVNGQPLRGRCDQCPEVDIGKKSESLQKDSRTHD